MERVERLVAHIDEGLTLAHSDQVARRRLALLLFDSAVELMMFRESSYLLARQEFSRRMLRQHDEALKDGYEPSAETRQWVEDARRRVTSAKGRREIDRFFDPKASFLGEAGLLQPGQVRVLKRLHKYRNEAYHEDRLRPHTLDSALRIYVLVICELLRNLPVHSLSYQLRTTVPPPTVAKYLGKEARVDFNIYRRVGEAILESEGMASSFALGEALSDHFIYRLDDFDERLDFIAEWLSEIRLDGPWQRDDVLCLVQIEDDQLAAFANREEVRAYAAPIGRSQLEKWRDGAKQLRCEADELAAFAAFSDLEDAFEPIELAVKKAAAEVDGAIQHEIDIQRGK